MLTIEERLKRIEDELGITERDNRKFLIKDVTFMCIQYGMTNHKAKGFAYNMVMQGYSKNELEELLIARGAAKRQPTWIKRIDDGEVFLLNEDKVTYSSKNTVMYTPYKYKLVQFPSSEFHYFYGEYNVRV